MKTRGRSWRVRQKAARTPSDSHRHNVEQDREVVGNAAGKDEDVPCRVEIAAMVECEEDDAQ